MAENKTKYTTLQAENGTVLYPKTSVKAVKDFDTGKTQKEINKSLQDDVGKLKTASDSNASELTTLKATLDEVKKGQKFQGAYTSVSSFPSIPSDIKETEGWYAILKVSNGNDKFYIVDQTEKKWIEKGESTSIIYDGIKKVNGLESVEGNVTIDATNINATVDGKTKTIQDTLIGLKDISDEQRELIEAVAAKHNVLYVTEAEMQDVDEIEDGQVVVCVEEGTYAQGSIYKLNAGVWEEITASGTEITDTLRLSKEVVIPALNGSVTYENLSTDYIFEQDKEGYWFSTITSNNGYSILKITFNLDRKTDIKFDFVQEKVGDYSRQVMFSDIDCLLSSSNSQDSVGVFKNTYNQTNGSVIYYDFPEGEHFVTVKLYKNYGGSNYPYLKFKLSTPIQSDIETKISSNSIYINDNNCLQIEDSDIINKNNINLLIGEKDKPIQLWNLSNGFYKIKGYFEILKIFNVSNEILNSGIVDVSVYTDSGNGFKIIFLYNALFKQTAENVGGYRDSSIMLDGFSKNPREYDIYNANAIIQLKYRLNNESATSVQYFSMHTDKNVLIKYNGSSRLNFYPAALPTDNTDKYTPLSDYNPATKKYVDDKILDYRPVLELDNPEEQIYVTNSIATSTDVDDNRLYYYKIVGSELIPNEVAYYTAYSGEILISKNILNCGITDWLFYINWRYNPYKGSSTVYDKSNYLTLSNGSLYWGNVCIYSPDVGWLDDGINDDNYFNLHRYILLNPSNFGFNGYEVYVEFNVSNYRISFDYLKNGKIVPVSKPTQLALYEDLANAGGSSGSGEFSGDTLTLSKEVVVPEVPAKEGIIIDSVENISTDYGFELNSDGYYESNNKFVEGQESYALCKVTFTVPKTMNVVWDVISSGENGYDFGIFSNLNMQLLDSAASDDDNNIDAVFKHFRYEGFPEVVKLTYENVEAGQYTIDIKYRKDSGGFHGNDSLQFKVADESLSHERIPEYTYTSQNSITIDENNNLQIEGENILTQKNSIEINGTKDNPIIINELTPGKVYQLSGYFKWTNSNQEMSFVSTDEFVYREGSSALIFVGEKIENFGQGISVIGGGVCNNNIVIGPIIYHGSLEGAIGASVTIDSGGGVQISNNLLRYRLVNLQGYSEGSVITTNNTTEYAPTEDYHPATKKYVDDSIKDNKPVSINDSFETNIIPGDIITKSNVKDNSLYYGKIKGQKEEKRIVKTNVVYEQIYIDKKIVNDLKYNEYANTAFNFCDISIWGPNTGSSTNFTLEINEEGKVRRIYYPGDSEYIYDYERGWLDNSDEGYFDLSSYFKKFFEWATTFGFVYFPVYESTALPQNYLVYPTIVDYAEPVRIALYEDLGNSGGGSNVADLEASIDTSTYTMKLKLVDSGNNVIGTEKTIDLPLESVVVGGTYNNGTKEIQLTLQNGNKVKIPVGDLVGGLVPTTRKINGKSLENDINLTAEDLGISFDGEPTIEANDGILTLKVNNAEVGQFSANQSDSATINIPVPVQSINGKTGDVTLNSDDINLSLLFEGEQEAIEVTVQEFGQMLAEEMPKLGSDVADLWNVSINKKGLTLRDIVLTANDIKFEKYNNNTLEKEISDMNVVINEVDAKADDAKNTASSANQKALQNETTINTLKAVTINNKALSGDVVLKTSDLINDSNYVNSSTLNNKAATLGSDINLTMNETNYQITAQLVNESGTALGTAKTIDLPLETMVVGASYDDATEKITLTLKNGTTTSFSVADLVKGLVSDTRTINGKPLSSNITLSASDVGALPSTTTIPTVNNGTLTIQKNGTTVKTFTANSSSNVTANIEVPTGTAADKNYTATMDNSDNLPTAAAIQAYVTSRGYVTSSGSVASATNANNAIYATNATNDEGGRNIYETYAKKSDLGTQAVFTLSGTTLTIVPK